MDLAIAGLEEDRLADLAVANHETEYVTLRFGIAGGGFERRDHSQFRVGVSPHPHVVRLQDIDSDGHADLLVDDRSPESVRLSWGLGSQDLAAASGEGTGSLATWHALAKGSFDAAGRCEIASGPTKSAAADLTGDGSAEVLVASYAGGERGEALHLSWWVVSI